MATLTITNLTSVPVPIQGTYATVPPNGTIDVIRLLSQLEEMDDLFTKRDAGLISWTLALSPWELELRGSGPLFNAKNQIHVDGSTTVPTASQTGTPSAPFKTIQQAINVVPEAQTLAEAQNVYCVIIAPGDYDEDLAIDITGRRILLLSPGPWGLGQFNGNDWAPSGTRRNITISGTSGNISGIRPAFGIANFPNIGQRYSTHQSYITGVRISGQILFTVSSGGSLETLIEAEVFGTTGSSGGVSIDASGTNPILQLYLYNSRLRGQLLGGTNSQLQHAEKSRFAGLVDVGAYSLLDRCQLNGGFTVGSASPAGLVPQGFLNSVFTAGTFTGPAGSLRLDAYTNYWFKTNGVALAGGATKVIYGDLVA